jgi:predicted DNA-binding transcriptional regulator AlpA
MDGIQNDPRDQKEKTQPGKTDLVGRIAPDQAVGPKFVHKDDGDELLDAASTAAFLGLSERTLERWRRERTGPSFIRLSVRAIRYRLSDLRAWRDGRTVTCA